MICDLEMMGRLLLLAPQNLTGLTGLDLRPDNIISVNGGTCRQFRHAWI
jgi:hypothetical protein